MIESVVTFKWRPKAGYRSHFHAQHVNMLQREFKRFLKVPHRFICVTDDPKGLDPAIEPVPLWNTFANIPNPTWPNGPSCYRRLVTFGRDFAAIAGQRFVCVDLDVVITRDVTQLFDRPEDFVIWGTGDARIPYCASLYMMTAGAKEEVLTRFDPKTSPALSQAAGYRGSDQGWINYCLGKSIPTWGRRHGVYSYRNHLHKLHRGKLPHDARVVIFHGTPDPWDHKALQASPWIREYLQ